MTTPVPNQGPPLIILTKLPPPARVLPLLTPLWWAQDLQQLEEKLLNVLEWLFPFAAFIAETSINWAKEGVLGAFRAALSISMIHKSSKWCIGIQFPNREQSLNDIIWKKVEKVAQLQLVSKTPLFISTHRSPQSLCIQNTSKAITISHPRMYLPTPRYNRPFLLTVIKYLPAAQ